MNIERKVFNPPWSATMMKDSLRSAHTKSWGLFHVSSSTQPVLVAIAIVSIIFDEAEILHLSVAKDYQGQGCAQRLMTYLLDHLKSHEVEKITLEVNVNNEPAIALYRKYNFLELTIRKNYYDMRDGTFEDAMVLQLEF